MIRCESAPDSGHAMPNPDLADRPLSTKLQARQARIAPYLTILCPRKPATSLLTTGGAGAPAFWRLAA
eukprot:10387015-Heterocapsa_arctica.AAC.1